MALASVTVYSFEAPDVAGVRHMPFKATREAIESRHGGRVIDGTGEHVPLAALDGEGRYQRQASGWTPHLLQQIE
jgi:hypothetical protein